MKKLILSTLLCAVAATAFPAPPTNGGIDNAM